MFARLRGAVFVLIVFGALCFAAFTIFTEMRARTIDQENEQVRQDATPSTELLLNVNANVQATAFAAQSYGLGAGADHVRDAMTRAQSDAAAELQAYLALPLDPGENEIQEELVDGMDRLGEAVSDFLLTTSQEHSSAGREAALRAVQDSSSELTERIHEALVLTNHQTEVAVARIALARRRATRDALIAASTALLFTVALGVITTLTMRRYRRLAEEHENLLNERASDLERFGERLTHDLRGPLGNVAMAMTVMKKLDNHPDPKFDDTLARAERSLARALDLMESFFRFARAGGRMEPGATANVRLAVEATVSEVEHSKEANGAEITVEPFEQLVVACEEGVLTSIMENLLRNAVKYTRDSLHSEIYVRASKRGDTVHVEVEDNGPGIPPELAEKVFEPYMRVSGSTQSGLGLGLATVKRFCDARGGKVGVRSPGVGRGATFWFELPLTA